MMLLAAWTHYLFGSAMFLTALFLILVVLVQRGRGGGLSGALGGMGGQSAFGTKAGDTFTKITMVTAIFWVLLCMASIKVLMPPKQIGSNAPGAPTIEGPSTDAGAEDAAGDGAGGAGITPGGGAGADSTPNGATDGNP